MPRSSTFARAGPASHPLRQRASSLHAGCSTTCSPTPSARCATPSRQRSSSARRSRSTSRSTCCSATSRGRPATGCRARASRRGSSPTSRSTGRRGARRRTAAGTSTRSWRARRRSRWRSCSASSASPSSRRPSRCTPPLPDASPLIGDGRLERAGLTVEIAHPDPAERPPAGTDAAELEYAVEITYEGLYELAEETLADGASSLLDEHFGALGGWIASTLVRLGDLRFAFLPADDGSRLNERAARPATRSIVAMTDDVRCCPSARVRAHRHDHAEPARGPQRAVQRGAAPAPPAAAARPTATPTSTSSSSPAPTRRSAPASTSRSSARPAATSGGSGATATQPAAAAAVRCRRSPSR